MFYDLRFDGRKSGRIDIAQHRTVSVLWFHNGRLQFLPLLLFTIHCGATIHLWGVRLHCKPCVFACAQQCAIFWPDRLECSAETLIHTKVRAKWYVTSRKYHTGISLSQHMSLVSIVISSIVTGNNATTTTSLTSTPGFSPFCPGSGSVNHHFIRSVKCRSFQLYRFAWFYWSATFYRNEFEIRYRIIIICSKQIIYDSWLIKIINMIFHNPVEKMLTFNEIILIIYYY